MNTPFVSHDALHRLGERATHPMEPHCVALASLLLLAGNTPRRRHAQPAHRIAAHSGVCNGGIQVESKS
jgi:hypothetical protein